MECGKRKQTVIIIAEDDPDDRLLLQDALNEACRSVVVKFANDGAELLDYLYRRGKYSDPKDAPLPELVLLDLNMPKVSGMEVLERMKRDRALRSIPIVILTTSRAPEYISRTYDLGCNGFITKPTSYDELVAIMETLNNYWFQTVRLPS